MNRHVNYLISGVARRYRLIWLAWFLSIAWVAWAFAVFALTNTESLPHWNFVQKIYFGVGVFASTLMIGSLGCLWQYRNPRWLASQVEEHFPTLQQRLITAVQIPESSGFFEKSLVDETIHHARANDWTRTVSDSRILAAWLCQFVLLGCASWAIVRSLGSPGDSEKQASVASLIDSIAPDALVVEPGDVEVEKGTDVVVTARFPDEAPPEVWLETRVEKIDPVRQSMSRSLKDPLYGAYVRNVQMDQEYRIDYVSGSTRPYKIKTFEFPSLVRSDATIESPAYANNDPRTIENTRRVTVADGAKLTWICFVNKPLESAELVDESGEVTSLIASTENPLRYQATFDMSSSKRWKVHLVDLDKRVAKFEEELSAKVLPNQPPEMKLARASDLRVSPLQEVQIKATAKDDFGIKKSGLTLMMGDREPVEVEISGDVNKAGKVDLAHLVDLESLKAEPDQLLSYFFWAADLDRDGNERRVEGEMFFAEVRPFEEIFREGESPSQEQQQQQQQQQSEGGQKAEELAEMQKQIVTATWNILRREKPDSLTKGFLDDIRTLKESQEQAFEKAQGLREQLKDDKSLDYLEDVLDSMTTAIESLEDTSIAADLKSLRAGLQSEREAYAGLLRLRAREHSIVRSKQQKSSSSSKSSSQRNRQEQLEQLKLQDDENRYESEKQADAPEPTAQRETRQVMNRLEELARRQKDINEQLKNLESALREAKTEEQKKDIEEQLKRLRDNQEDLLRDSDELLERMNEPENRQAMQEAREQTEQARSDLQQSSESIAKGETSQALSSGTRAERQLEETREQLRNESSNQFEQTMRELVQKANQLDKQQQQLTEKLPSSKSPDSKGTPEGKKSNDPSSQSSLDPKPDDESATPLRPEGNEKSVESLQQAWQEQKKNLNALLEKMRETVSDSESSEPLLAEQLYESFREAKQQGLEQRLDQIPTLVERGLEEPASRAAGEVAKGIQTLRENVEQASESVIGSEQESLRRALSELQRAQRQLDEELARKDPRSKANPSVNPKEAGGEPNPHSQTDPKGQSNPDGNPTPDAKSNAEGKPSPEGQPSPDGQAGQPRPEGKPSPDGQAGQPSQGRQPGNSEQARGEGQPSPERQASPERQPGGQAQPSNRPAGAASGSRLEQLAQESGGGTHESAPLTGGNYSEWIDSLRDVEELVRDPELRAEAGRIREAARSMRVEYKRHSKEPEWPLVRRLIAEPLDQLREKVQEELLRQSAEKSSLIPIDRDPVPSIYQRQLDRYYENIGSGKNR